MKERTGLELQGIGLILTWGATALLCFGVAGAYAASRGAGKEEIFRLDSGSRYQHGCFPPCMCPVLEQQGVRGTLTLRHEDEVGGVKKYAVEDVNWTVPLDPPLRIIGTGRYSVGSPGLLPVLQHRMELDLILGTQPVQHFDSGWVAFSEAGTINITVSLNNEFCLDTIILIEASPVPEDEIARYELVEGSTAQRGCFDPCACPLGLERPLAGTFTLVPLIESLPLTEFAVVGIRWEIRGDDTSDAIPISGLGVYQLLGDFTLQQRLALDLVVGSEPRAHFDSGPRLEGSGLPRVDIVVSLHGVSCYDTVLHVVAERSSGKTCGGIAGLPCGEGEFCESPVGRCCCDEVGVCTALPDACVTLWDPVCGCDGVTYGNDCEARRSAVSLAHRGACEAPCSTNADCDAWHEFCAFAEGTCGASGSPGRCSPIPLGQSEAWDPVCGCDGVTYRSELEASARGVSVHHRGACEPESRLRRKLAPGRTRE